MKHTDILALPEELQHDATYDWILDENVQVIIAFSGGKDSVAMVLDCLNRGVPRNRITLMHHDVDGHGENLFDWACTPSYCQAFADAFELRLLFSHAEGGILREIYRENETVRPVHYQKEPGGRYYKLDPKDDPRYYSTRRKFPAVSADLNVRWCSWIAKIGVMAKVINNMEEYKDCNLVVMTGERRLESTARSKYKTVELHRCASKKRRALHFRPILERSEEWVWDQFREWRIQPHPCYELGWGRCSCQTCIFGSANTWAAIMEISPEKIDKLVTHENTLGHTLYHDKKGRGLMEVRVLAGASFIPPEAKERWLEEALGIFVSPIFVTVWHLPAGAFTGEAAGSV